VQAEHPFCRIVHQHLALVQIMMAAWFTQIVEFAYSSICIV